MRNAIVALLLFTASAALAQFTGGGCSSGGLVDRYSDQSISGLKNFCSTATFNTGFALGLNPHNTLGLMPLQAPTGVLYWGNRQVCDSSGNCPGGGVLPPGFPDDYLRFLTPGGPGGTIGRMAIYDSSYTVTNSIIQQDDGSDTILFNNNYTLTMVSTSSIPTIYSATGISTTQNFSLQTTASVGILASNYASIQGGLGAKMVSYGDIKIATPGNIEIKPTDKLKVTTTDIVITASGNLIINGYVGLTNVIQGPSCGVGVYQRLNFVKGILMGQDCY